MEHRILDNHAAYNRWQVMEGMRVSEEGTEPSVYVALVKLKKVFNLLTEPEIRRLFKEKRQKGDRTLTDIGIRFRKEKLAKKLEILDKQQLLTALNIYNRELDGELCASYVLACNRVKKEE